MLSTKILFLLGVVIAVATADTLVKKGGVKHLEGDDLKAAENILNESLAKLATGDGPTYTVVKVTEATSQVVSGSLYKYRAELKDRNGDLKKCNAEIWSQPWLENGIQVTLDCEGDEKVVKKHSALVK